MNKTLSSSRFWIIYPLGLALWERGKLAQFIQLNEPLGNGEISDEAIQIVKKGPRAEVYLADPYSGSLLGEQYKNIEIGQGREILEVAVQEFLPGVIGDAPLAVSHLSGRDGAFFAAVQREVLDKARKAWGRRVGFIAPLPLVLAWHLNARPEPDALLVHYSEEGGFSVVVQKEAGEIREILYYVSQGTIVRSVVAHLERELYRYTDELSSALFLFSHCPVPELTMLQTAHIEEADLLTQPYPRGLLLYPQASDQPPALGALREIILWIGIGGAIGFGVNQGYHQLMVNPMQRQTEELRRQIQELKGQSRQLDALEARKRNLEEMLRQLRAEQVGVQEALLGIASVPEEAGLVSAKLDLSGSLQVQARSLDLLQQYVTTLKEKGYQVQYGDIRIKNGSPPLVEASLSFTKPGAGGYNTPVQ